jgi:hypothetical protein
MKRKVMKSKRTFLLHTLIFANPNPGWTCVRIFDKEAHEKINLSLAGTLCS